jgi:hypothetical protein
MVLCKGYINDEITMSVKQPLICALVILFTSVHKLYIWAALLVLALFDEYNFISQMQ